MKEFTPTKRHVAVSVGESVRILRALQELSQNELAGYAGHYDFWQAKKSANLSRI
jgi:hypothetical protein